MNASALGKFFRQMGASIVEHSPVILTSLGVAGVISSVLMAIKATPTASRVMADIRYEAKNEGLDKPDPVIVFKALAPLYAPTALMTLGTIGCIIASNRISMRRQAALVGLYALAETSLREYQDSVIKRFGEKKNDIILDDMAEKKMLTAPQNNNIVVSGTNVLCFDALSGRYFSSDLETIRQVQNEFNDRLLREMTLSINELYYELRLPTIDLGDRMGWTIEKGMVKFRFTAKLDPKGVPCIVLTHDNLPTAI